MAKVLMITSSYPKSPEDYRGIFVSDIFQELLKYYSMDILVPDDADGVNPEDNKIIFRYFFKRLQKLAYGNGILTNLKAHPFLALEIPFFIIAQILAIRKIIKKNPQIKIIHAHWLFPQGFSAVIAKNLFAQHIKVICSTHGSDIFSLNGLFWSAIKRFTLKHATKILVVSKESEDALLALNNHNDKYLVCPAAINLKKFHFKPKILNAQSPRLLFVGRLTKEKGIWDLIKAMRLLAVEMPNILLTVIGEGPERKNLDNFIAQKKLAKNIIFLGALPNNQLSAYYQKSDIFVLPSYSEGIPVSLMEAMASGTVTIATPVGGIPNIIKDGLTGFLCEVAQPQKLANQILKIYQNCTPQEIQRIRSSAFKQISQGDYNIEYQIEKIITLYKSLSDKM